MKSAAIPLAVALLLAGCAAQSVHNEGLQQLRDGKVAQAVQTLRKAADMDPGNARYRIDYLTQRELAAQALLSRADEARAAGRLDEAAERYREALQIDDSSERALRGARLVVEQRKADAAIAQAERYAKGGQTESAQDVLRRAAKDLPGNASLQAQLKDAAFGRRFFFMVRRRTGCSARPSLQQREPPSREELAEIPVEADEMFPCLFHRRRQPGVGHVVAAERLGRAQGRQPRPLRAEGAQLHAWQGQHADPPGSQMGLGSRGLQDRGPKGAESQLRGGVSHSSRNPPPLQRSRPRLHPDHYDGGRGLRGGGS